VTVNPYSPPTGPIGQAPVPEDVPKSFARKLSFILAAGGFLAFWGGGALMVYSVAKEDVTDATGMLFGVIMLLAASAHLVGIAIVFAAPRGRRLLPALLNVAALAIMIAATVWGYRMGPG
jgi:hypothetical protein